MKNKNKMCFYNKFREKKENIKTIKKTYNIKMVKNKNITKNNNKKEVEIEIKNMRVA